MMSCKKATRLISEGQDRALTRSERLRLSMHTMMCRSCRRFDTQMGLLRNIAHGFSHADTPEAPDDEDSDES